MPARGNWSLSQEEEEDYRRSLFKRAKKGEKNAQAELWATYGVRLYTESEKGALVYDAPPPRRSAKTVKKTRTQNAKKP